MSATLIARRLVRLTIPDWIQVAVLATLLMLTLAGWNDVAAAPRGALVYVALIATVVTTRKAAARYARMQVVADFLPIVVVTLSYLNLNPAIDATTPVLYDAQLANVDTAIFGATPALVLQHLAHPWVVEVLSVSYLTYYFWPIVLAVWIYQRQRALFESYVTAVLLCMLLNQVAYVLVPAVGPRFYLAEAFAAPLEGVLLGPLILEQLRHAPILRDCFPSGHTATTLLVLLYAWRYARAVAWVMTPVALLLFAATILCRFHYGVDLVGSVALVALSFALAPLLPYFALLVKAPAVAPAR